jgi:hypothetical protein
MERKGKQQVDFSPNNFVFYKIQIN